MAAAQIIAPGRQSQISPAKNLISPWSLVLLAILLFGASAALPRVRENVNVSLAIWGAMVCLVALAFLLHRRIARQGRKIYYTIALRPVHYVQAMCHSSIYLYWGQYWPEVYHHVPLLGVQIAFGYALDMMLCWWRRDEWLLGFGLFPIVLSTNLFLWFRDDWFYLQLVLIATGVFGKEFLKWKREGRMTHIFNPSSFSLCVFAVVLISTGATGMTFAQEISTTLGHPPYMYVEMFLVGLVVQYLFSVTLVTLSAAGTLCLLNLAFTGWTGVYQFIDTNIPIAVFLGLHLLVTDPATSPRRPFGKFIFGSLYGAAVFGMYGFLSWLGVPRFYDKLLCVPALNLAVPALEWAGEAIKRRVEALDFSAFRDIAAWSPRKLNLAHMGLWIPLATTMIGTGFIGGHQPGDTTAFWQRACTDGRWHACQTWEHTLAVTCDRNVAADCFALGTMRQDGHLVPKNLMDAARNFDQACDLGDVFGCTSFQALVEATGTGPFQQDCDRGRDHSNSCYLLGLVYQQGRTAPKDDARARALFQQACNGGSARGCGRLAESFFLGRGGAVDKPLALESFELACRAGYGPGCFNAGIMYRRGDAGPKDDAYGLSRVQQACEMGVRAACPPPAAAVAGQKR